MKRLIVTFIMLLCVAVTSWGDCLGENGLTVLASQWLRGDCAAPNWCHGADVDQSGDVNIADFTRGLGPCEPLALVSSGVCRVSIHNIAVGTPNAAEQYAAQQLQLAFQTACGVTPAINPATPAAVQIKLGLAKRFAVSIGSSHEQAYCMRRTLDNNIDLVGNSSPAVLWAVDAFCRDVLQVVWPVADDAVTRIGPLQTNVIIERLCQVDSPDFERRGWIIGDNADGYHYNDEICNWMAHTRQNVVYGIVLALDSARDKKIQRGIETDTTMHSFWWLVPADTYYDAHPEYFPLINGVRVRPGDSNSTYVQLCLSNPAIAQITVQKAVQAFYNYPELRIFGVCQNDGSGGWCQCDNCRAWDGDQAGTGQYSNRLIHFINLVANQIGPFYPTKKIGTYAYSETIEPPTETPAPNVAITFCTGGRNYMKKLTDPTDAVNAPIMSRLAGWLNKASYVSFWEYYYYSGLEKCPSFYSRTLCQEFLDLYALGLKGMCSETYPSIWPGMSLFSYTFSRLSWDTSLDYETILDAFSLERYGSAAAAMKAYHQLYEDTLYARLPEWTMSSGGEQLLPAAFTDTEIATLDGYLADATTAAAGDTAYHRNAVAAECGLFNEFKKLRIDPATLPGVSPNLVENPGAEDGSTGWFTNIQFGNYAFSTPTGGAHSGEKSLAIQCTGTPGWSRWYRGGIPGFTIGKKYALRLWVRTTGDVNANGKIWVYFGGARTVYMNFVDTNDQWAILICPEFTATAETCTLYLNSYGPGTVRFDDIFIAELPE